MKNITKKSTDKLVAAFDNELKTLLMNELKAIKNKTNRLSTAA